jgi:4-hydroxy-L-threonine phosphate dehydrogenase PdxA
MEDATAEDTIIEKHGADMYIIRSNNETLTIKDAYNSNGGIIATVTIYEKDGTSYGPIWVYPNNSEKAVNVYDDEGVIVPDAYAYAQNFRVTGETTTIKTDELYKVDHGTNYVIYGTNSVNPVTVDLSWCYSS